MKQIALIFLGVSLFGAVQMFAAEKPRSERQLKRVQGLLSRFKHERIVFKQVDGETLDMILFLPSQKKFEKAPFMVYTHGGGWDGGDKFKVFGSPFLEALETILDSGIACATIEYRLTELGKSTAVDCVVDCKDAVRFLVKNADAYGLDPERIGVWGGSAGGHLSLMTGLAENHLFAGYSELQAIDPKFKCIASYYPVTSFDDPELLKEGNLEGSQRLVSILGGPMDEKRDVAKLISPANHLRTSSPKTLLIHGTDDKIYPIAQSEYMLKVAKEKGASVELLTVDGGGHSFIGNKYTPSLSEINQIAAKFIIENLTGK